jgi:hypothetical protein
MFCKNARSKLAMAAMSESESKPAPVITPEPVVAQAQVTPISAFMDALRLKVPEQHNNNNQFKAFPSYGNSSLQLLQRQLEMMQQEQTNKRFELLQQERNRFLEQAAIQNLLPSAPIKQQQQPNGQAARLLQMQQLMQMQMQQRQGRAPTNPRASAA